MYQKIILRSWVLVALIGLIAGLCVLPAFADEQLTITTYYPSPYGSYKELRLSPNTSPSACDNNNKGALWYDDGPDNQLKVCRGTALGWQAVGVEAGWAVPVDITVTTATHNGNFGGYAAMNNWIQTRGCSGYHVCDATEITRWLQTGNAMLSGWYNAGMVGESSDYYASECYGWTDTSGFGSFFGASRPQHLSCNSAIPVLCCR